MNYGEAVELLFCHHAPHPTTRSNDEITWLMSIFCAQPGYQTGHSRTWLTDRRGQVASSSANPHTTSNDRSRTDAASDLLMNLHPGVGMPQSDGQRVPLAWILTR